MAEVDRTLRSTATLLVRHRADALSEGNERKASVYTQALLRRGIYLINTHTTESMAQAQANLQMLKVGFDPFEVSQGLRIEVWATTAKTRDEFTIAVLIGPNGLVRSQRIINGY